MHKLGKALITAVWFMVLTLPVMGIRLNLLENTVQWRFDRILALGVAIFFLSLLWNWCFARKARGLPLVTVPPALAAGVQELMAQQGLRRGGLALLVCGLLAMPLVGSFYQTNIMISAMLYIMLALGLNIVVGLAGRKVSS